MASANALYLKKYIRREGKIYRILLLPSLEIQNVSCALPFLVSKFHNQDL